MAPKAYKPVQLEQEARTTKTDNSAKTEGSFGEQQVYNCSVPYGGGRTATNATINPAELQIGIRRQKEAFAKSISDNIEYQRVKRGKRMVKHRLPVEEEYTDNDEIILKRKSTITKRMEN